MIKINPLLLKSIFFVVTVIFALLMGLWLGNNKQPDYTVYDYKIDSLKAVVKRKELMLKVTASQRDSARAKNKTINEKIDSLEKRSKDNERKYLTERSENRKRWLKMSSDSLAQEAKKIYLKAYPDSTLIDDDTVVTERLVMIYLMDKTEQVPYLEQKLVEESTKVELKNDVIDNLNFEISTYKADLVTNFETTEALRQHIALQAQQNEDETAQLKKELRKSKFRAVIATGAAIILGVAAAIL